MKSWEYAQNNETQKSKERGGGREGKERSERELLGQKCEKREGVWMSERDGKRLSGHTA